MRKKAKAAGAKLPSKRSQDWIVSTQAGPAPCTASELLRRASHRRSRHGAVTRTVKSEPVKQSKSGCKDGDPPPGLQGRLLLLPSPNSLPRALHENKGFLEDSHEIFIGSINLFDIVRFHQRVARLLDRFLQTLRAQRLFEHLLEHAIALARVDFDQAAIAHGAQRAIEHQLHRLHDRSIRLLRLHLRRLHLRRDALALAAIERDPQREQMLARALEE